MRNENTEDRVAIFDEMLTIQRRITEIKNNKTLLTARKADIEGHLATLKGRVREGGSLPQHIYNDIVKKQKRSTGSLLDLEKKIGELNIELRALYTRDNELRLLTTKDAMKTQFGPTMPVLLDQSLCIQVKLLRNKYLAFAEDFSRVSSMRLIASQIAADLTDLLSAYGGGDESAN